ncbi:MAG: Fpg/Nei family DNA glycosylase [Actinomycetota bacterium]|nr:Fpg/Nei family DNA glycosylase [Actinomycetota bacterium]
MPEGDVVWRTAQRLSAALSGRELVLADLRWPSLATADLTGRTVIETVARGKHLLTRLAAGPTGSTGPNTVSPVTLHSHLRMDGSWRVDRTTESVGRTRSRDVRAVLANDEWTATGISLGMLELVATTDEATLVGHLGPDILGPDWDLDRVLANLRATPERAIGAALLDQRVLAGVGTFYLAETMFLVGRTPWTPIGDLTEPEQRRVVERAYRLLHLNRDRVVQVTTGDARPGYEAYAHGRASRPCRRCGTMVRVARIGQPPADRVAFYCPTCQTGPTPTDDGRPQGPIGSIGRAGH